MTKLQVILFNDFETLDAFGPVEVFGMLKQFYEIEYYSQNGGTIKSCQNVKLETLPVSRVEEGGVLLIPGGLGTRNEICNDGFISAVKALAEKAKYVLTVCTGSGLLAKTGMINGIKATSNKMAFEWAVAQGPEVQWIRRARWVHDGKYYTSSGVSAGIDMALGFISDTLSRGAAEKLCAGMEYIWNENKDEDPFA